MAGEERERVRVECWGIGGSDKMWQWAHWLTGWLLLYTPITQCPCPPRHFNLIPRPKETKAQHCSEESRGAKGLFQAFSFHLCGWVFNFITKMAAPFLITFYFICWVCVDAVWMNGLSWSGLCVNCVYMCACACKCTALLLIGLVRERETSTLSASPPPPLVTACIIDPEQLHFLSVSEFIRWSAFTQPDRIPPSSSFP